MSRQRMTMQVVKRVPKIQGTANGSADEINKHCAAPHVIDRFIRDIGDLNDTNTFVNSFLPDLISLFDLSKIENLQVESKVLSSRLHIVPELKLDGVSNVHMYIIHTTKYPIVIELLGNKYHIRARHSAVLSNLLHTKGFSIQVNEATSDAALGVYICKLWV